MDRPVSPAEARLLELFRCLPATKRRTLLDFAACLGAGAARPGPPAAPAPRPARESVVQAIRRLVRAHPQLDRARLMSETSRCLALHMVDGREAAAVIDELESIFARELRRTRGRAGA